MPHGLAAQNTHPMTIWWFLNSQATTISCFVTFRPMNSPARAVGLQAFIYVFDVYRGLHLCLPRVPPFLLLLPAWPVPWIFYRGGSNHRQEILHSFVALHQATYPQHFRNRCRYLQESAWERNNMVSANLESFICWIKIKHKHDFMSWKYKLPSENES